MKSVAWNRYITDYKRYLVGIGRTENTIYLRHNQLRYLAKSINIHPAAVTEKDLTDWFGHHDWRTETRRSYRAAVRGFFAWAHKYQLIGTDPARDLPVVQPERPVPRPAPDTVWVTAVMAADPRVMLMLRLAAEAGLRRGEVARVHTRDLREGAGGPQLLVHGKGRRERLIPITDELAALIAAGPAGHTPGAATTGWLFPGGDRGHLSPPWVGALCSRVMPEIWTMHALRHRFATRAYRGSRNLRAVQQLLGHANVAITERYTAVDDDEMRQAMSSAVA